MARERMLSHGQRSTRLELYTSVTSGHGPNGHVLMRVLSDYRICATRQGVAMIVYAVIDVTSSPTSPLGEAIEVFLRREDAERFIEEIDGDDSELAAPLTIEARELEAGGLN